MSTTWNTGRLGDVCRVVPGYAFKSSDWQADGIPVVKIKNITGNNSVDLATTDCVPQGLLTPKLQKFVVKDGDILVAMTGATAGKVGKVRTNRPLLLNQRVAKIAPVDADPDFIWAIVSSQEYQERFFYLADGAAQPNMSGGQIEGVEVPLPPLPVQRRIAGILTAYDELIENSQRRIKILDSMARALYREWFVHFRFPGHESVPRVPSPLGEIPQGWEVKKLSAVAEVNRSQINARSALEALHYIEISSVSPGQIDSTTTYAFADAPGRARRIVQHGDMLWSCVRPNRRSYAQVMHPAPDTIASTGFAVLTATKVPFTFLFFATTTDDFVAYLTNNATGAAYPAVTAPTFEKADLLVPSVALLKKFGDVTIPIAEEIHTLQRQIQNLRRTRDLLLPRLLSGQIDVEAIPS
ncbi:restriction endonuclease subunit S [Chlorobium sp. N1]|uniref:restriction endonuclease subunit S n=1 Tax=Chlorobium sp. N1 TaxID=2491138 RepID=UPI0013F144BD|nr:restriction endonuclease subunit S [Chlorobium sp. N1]